MVGGEVDVHRHRLQHRRPGRLAQFHQRGHRGRLSTQVGGDHHRTPGGRQGGGELLDHLRGEGGGRDRREGRGRVRLLRRVGLHHLARADQVHRSGRVAAGKLQGTVHHLLDVRTGADLVVVPGVPAHDAALVVDVLDPVDELVAAPEQLAVLGERGGAREHQHPDAPLRGVVHHAAEILGPALDMHDHGLRHPGHLRVSLRRGHRDTLVRAHEQCGQFVLDAVRAGLRVRLQETGVVAAEIGEHVPDAPLGEGLQECPAGRVRPHVRPLGTQARSFRLVVVASLTRARLPRQENRFDRRNGGRTRAVSRTVRPRPTPRRAWPEVRHTAARGVPGPTTSPPSLRFRPDRAVRTSPPALPGGASG